MLLTQGDEVMIIQRIHKWKLLYRRRCYQTLDQWSLRVSPKEYRVCFRYYDTPLTVTCVSTYIMETRTPTCNQQPSGYNQHLAECMGMVSKPKYPPRVWNATWPKSLLEYLEWIRVSQRYGPQVGSVTLQDSLPIQALPNIFLGLGVDISVTVLHVTSCLNPLWEDIPWLSNYKMTVHVL